MSRHRCTRCKEDVGQYGIRHKYAGGLFCEPCMRQVRGVKRGFWGSFWDFITALVIDPFRPKQKPARKDVAIKVTYSAMRAKARNIPIDSRTMVPQKR